jgi:hypothetical protein
VKILKEQMKKKEENETKYQGKRNTMILDNDYSFACLYHRVVGSTEYDRRAASQRVGFTQGQCVCVYERDPCIHVCVFEVMEVRTNGILFHFIL